MFLLKLLITLCFVIVGVIMYYVKVCLLNDCKMQTNSGIRNVMPLEGFTLPFKKLMENEPKLFLKLLLSPINPWIYMMVMAIIGLIVANIFIRKQQKKNKQLTMNNLYPDQEQS
jgi:hypothetical protein